MNIGDLIRKRRNELGWSQQTLADKMGYTSKSTINKIEKGKCDVAQKNIVKFADVLGVSVAYLMDWEENEIEPAGETDSTKQELMEVFDQLNPDVQSQVLKLAKTFLPD